MTHELSLGLLPSTARQFKSLIADIHEKGILSKQSRKSEISAPAANIRFNDFPVLITNPVLNAKYKQELLRFRKREEGILAARRLLPVNEEKQDIIRAIKNNQVVVITGETGCGKTTQIPQFILDDHIERDEGSVCRIICCQPRKLSAAGVAERVANERMVFCGGSSSSVGYRIRFDYKNPRSYGCILFCTTGVLQNLIVADKTLSFCSHIIIDEVHERRLDVDFLITTLRELIKVSENSRLRIVLMSATIKPESFAEYFDNCPVINIPGRTHPVEKHMLEDVFELTKFQPTVKSKKLLRKSKAVTDDFIEDIKDKYSPETVDRLQNWDETLDHKLVLSLLKYICERESKGSILIFYPGWDEIHELRKVICEDDMFNNPSYRIVILHSRIQISSQVQVFDPPPRGTRKIIIATNIAEASVTIDDVVFVIDCGFVKVSNFDVNTKIKSLDMCWISKSSAQQRRGRAGRSQPGKCYHLFTSHRESLLDEFPRPEIVHSSLEEISLKMKFLNLYDIKTFYSKAMDEPHSRAIELSTELLQALKCLDKQENLTPLGSVVAQLPLNPQLGKTLLFGAIFSCLEPILTITAVLDYENPFYMPDGGRIQAKSVKEMLSNNSMSDHITFARAYEGWERSKAQGKYCKDCCLSIGTLLMMSKLRYYYASYLYRLGYLSNKSPCFEGSNKNSENEELLKAILCAGLYPNIAIVDRTLQNVRYFAGEKRVHINPWCILNICTEFTGEWLVYYKRVKVRKLQLYDVSVIRPMSLFLFGANIEESNKNKMVLSGSIEVHSPCESLQVLKNIHETFLIVINKVITDWKTINWGCTNPEMEFIKAIIEHICKKRKSTTVSSS